jgi:hypothetical protein
MPRKSDLPPEADPLEQRRRTSERAIASVSKTPEERKRNRRVTSHLSPKTNHALDLMAFEGFTDAEAAARVGMRTFDLREDLKSPVVSAMLAERGRAFRSGQTLRSWHRLAQIADDDSQPVNARVAANKALLSDDRARSPSPREGSRSSVNVNVNVSPGMVIPAAGLVVDLSQPDPREQILLDQMAPGSLNGSRPLGVPGRIIGDD